MSEQKPAYLARAEEPATSPFNQSQLNMLAQPLDPKRVKHREGGKGKQLSYLTGFDVIDTANRIFGYGKWGFETVGVEFVPVGNEGGGYYAARVRLSVAGCEPISDEGFGEVTSKYVSGHEVARKGAVTDGLKRCLRCYGEQFGNSLYDTDLIDGQPRQEIAQQQNRAASPAAPRTSQGGPGGQKPAQTTTSTTVPQNAPKPSQQQQNYFTHYAGKIAEAMTIVELNGIGADIKRNVTDENLRKDLRDLWQAREEEVSGASKVKLEVG